MRGENFLIFASPWEVRLIQQWDNIIYIVNVYAKDARRHQKLSGRRGSKCLSRAKPPSNAQTPEVKIIPDLGRGELGWCVREREWGERGCICIRVRERQRMHACVCWGGGEWEREKKECNVSYREWLKIIVTAPYHSNLHHQRSLTISLTIPTTPSLCTLRGMGGTAITVHHTCHHNLAAVHHRTQPVITHISLTTHTATVYIGRYDG